MLYRFIFFSSLDVGGFAAKFARVIKSVEKETRVKFGRERSNFSLPLTKERYDYFFDPTSNPFVNAFFFTKCPPSTRHRFESNLFRTILCRIRNVKRKGKEGRRKIRERGIRLISGRIDRRFENPRFGRPLNLRSSGKFLEIIVAVASEKFGG